MHSLGGMKSVFRRGVRCDLSRADLALTDLNLVWLAPVLNTQESVLQRLHHGVERQHRLIVVVVFESENDLGAVFIVADRQLVRSLVKVTPPSRRSRRGSPIVRS